MCLVAPSLAGGTEAKKMVGVYVLKKGNFSVKMTNWGATVMSIILPDSKGTMNKPVGNGLSFTFTLIE
jgi:aldose 1-epimerase